MNLLPPGWTEAVLSDVAKWSSGGTPKAGTTAYYGGEIPWAIIGDLNDGPITSTVGKVTREGLAASSAKVVPEGTVLIAMYGSIGKLGIAKFPLATNQAIACARVFPGLLNTYLFWWLRYQRNELFAAGKGGTQLNISQTVLKSWPILVAPLAEQHRIVEAIEAAFSKLDAGIAYLEAAKKRLARLRTALLLRAIDGDLTHLNGSPLSENFELGQIAIAVRNGLFVSRPSTTPPGVPILRIGAVRPMRLDPDQRGYADVDVFDERIRRYLLTPGDLLFTRYNGNPDFVGACAVVPTNLGPLLHPDKLIKVQLDRNRAEPRYVAIVVSIGKARHFIESVTKTTAGQAGISGADLRRVPISLPPVDVQQATIKRLERELSYVESCLTSIDIELLRSVTLRRSVLAAAFSGQLVPQDPTDEPASKLLERIAASRATAEPPTRTRRTRAVTTGATN